MNGKIIWKLEIEVRDRATEATSQSSCNQSTIGGKTPNLPQLKRCYKGEGRGDCPQQLWKQKSYQQ